MSPREPSGPDLDGVVADANAVALPFVVIGGFSVIANGFVRATRDSDLLVPDGPHADAAVVRFLVRSESRRLHDGAVLAPSDVADAEHLRVVGRHGIVDLLRGGLPRPCMASCRSIRSRVSIPEARRPLGLPY